MQSRSTSEKPIPSPMMNPLFKTLWWLKTTPFGKPVVPLVYWMLTGSSKSREAARSASSSALTPSPLRSTSLKRNIPLYGISPAKITFLRNGNFSDSIRPALQS